MNQRILQITALITLSLSPLTGFPQAGTWSVRAPLPLPRREPAVATVNGILYVAGGWNETDTASLFAYDPAAETWTNLAPMPAGRYDGSGAQEINGWLYVMGGWTVKPGLPHDDLFVYDPQTDSWMIGAGMPILSGCGVSGLIRGQLYVASYCDGYSGNRSYLHIYDPLNNCWSRTNISPSVHTRAAGGVLEGKLYVAGGMDARGSVTHQLDVYEPLLGT